MTYAYEKELNWKRILIEGDPVYRNAMLINSPLALSVNAAMCIESAAVHYSPKAGTGGIIEYMSSDFLKMFHSNLYNSCTPPGNLTSLDYSTASYLLKEVECMPLSKVLNAAHVKHVNYFILDVEGAELTVLKSINYKLVQFDVLCIETEPRLRPIG
jgi:FkbM family methyltransferase